MNRTKQSRVDETVKAFNIGQKIRDLRRHKNFTLKGLSKATQLSVPLLSQIENGAVVPIIPTLLRISKSLNQNIISFFQESMQDKKLAFVRLSERIRMNTRDPGHKQVGYRYESLAHTKTNKTMEPYFVEIGRKAGRSFPLYRHSGEEFIFVLRGMVEFKTDRDTYVFGPGDSIYFESDLPHATRAVGRKNAEALLVFCSPR